MALNPLGPVAGAFALDNSEIACIMGPVGSGKTTAFGQRLARHAFMQRPFIAPGKEPTAYTRFAIVRNTGPQLHDTTMKSWFKLFPTDNKWRKWTSTTKTQLWRFPVKLPNGTRYWINAEFMFRALDDEDDVANLLSLEVTGFGFNELREINTEILAHAGRRAGRYPGADLGGCTWRGWIGDTNPWAFTSDLHQMFVADPRLGYRFFKQPGGMDPDAENLENLEQTPETLLLPWYDPKRREQGRTYYINALRDYKAHDADMYVHCKYGASRVGKPVIPSYDDNAHCRVFELLKDKDGRVPIRIGYDNTGRHPAALIAQRTANGQWRERYEFIGDGIGLKAHVVALAQFLTEKIPNYRIERITCDPAGQAKDSGELDMRMIIQRQFPGVSVINARTNDIETRIDASESVHRRLVNGEPAVIMHPDCKILRAGKTFKYQYRKLKIAGEERYMETPDKVSPWADICDAEQYLFLGGGEGRVNSDSPGELDWGKTKAITPVTPDKQPKDDPKRWSGKLTTVQPITPKATFDPRNGSVFQGH